MSEIDIDELRSRFGRRLRIGFVGGGRDSVIGETHLAAMRVDGFFELYAGVFYRPYSFCSHCKSRIY